MNTIRNFVIQMSTKDLTGGPVFAHTNSLDGKQVALELLRPPKTELDHQTLAAVLGAKAEVPTGLDRFLEHSTYRSVTKRVRSSKPEKNESNVF